MWTRFTVLAAISLTPPLNAQAPITNPAPVNMCRPYLVQCNWAHLYSGTITYEAIVKVEQDTRARSAIVSEDRDFIRVDVTDGKAVCWETARIGHGTTFRDGKPFEESHDSVFYAGVGLVTVEFGVGIEEDPDRGIPAQPDQPWYQIRFACPVVGGVRVGIDLKTGQVVRDDVPPEEAALDHNDHEIYPTADLAKGRLLEGKTSYEHPDSDPVNSVRGTVEVHWSLTRKP